MKKFIRRMLFNVVWHLPLVYLFGLLWQALGVIETITPEWFIATWAVSLIVGAIMILVEN